MAFAKNAPKATLIRSLPADTTYDEACERVKAAGLGTLARSYFTKIRSEPGRRVKSNGNGHHAPPAPTLTNEQQFRKLVIALGTERSRKLLKDFESMSWS